jgi:hypothetical protein
LMLVPISVGDKHVPGSCLLMLNRYALTDES